MNIIYYYMYMHGNNELVKSYYIMESITCAQSMYSSMQLRSAYGSYSEHLANILRLHSRNAQIKHTKNCVIEIFRLHTL